MSNNNNINDSQSDPHRSHYSNNNKFNMKRLPLAQNPNQNKLRYNMDNDSSGERGYNRKINHFDSKRNNNKGYIIKRGEKINNNNEFNNMNNNEGINSGLNNDNNYNYKMPSEDNRFNNNDYYNREINPNNQVIDLNFCFLFPFLYHYLYIFLNFYSLNYLNQLHCSLELTFYCFYYYYYYDFF